MTEEPCAECGQPQKFCGCIYLGHCCDPDCPEMPITCAIDEARQMRED